MRDIKTYCLSFQKSILSNDDATYTYYASQTLQQKKLIEINHPITGFYVSSYPLSANCNIKCHYTLVSPLFKLSKCSLALMRSVAIELVRISELLMVILTALSLLQISVTSIVSDIFDECLSGDDGLDVCGDDDAVVGKRIPTGGVIRTP